MKVNLRLLAALIPFVVAVSSCPAQFGMGGGGFGGGGGGFGGGGGGFGGGGGGFGGGGGGGGGFPGGVRIDANGVVTAATVQARSAKLSRKRQQALADKALPGDLNRPSKLRKISLVRLEQACRQHEGSKNFAPLDIQFLAGLQRIDYVFADPEGGDVVIAGPAEGFAPDVHGRCVGVTTGRPPLRIDDLIVALRSVGRRGDLGVSIDPVPDKLAAAQRYLQQNSSATSVAVIRGRFQQLTRILGLQTVSLWGVPSDSHFAQVLLEADVQMKRISMGLEPSRVRGLRSHLSMLRPMGNSLQRWWFTPLYDAIYTTDDRLGFQFVGQRAQLSSQDEIVDLNGRRQPAATTRISTRQFAKQFTEKFPELADRSPVFAQLQNLMDLAILTALLRRERLPQKIGWTMDFFLAKDKARLSTGKTPRQVPTICNLRSAKRRLILGLVGGGVSIDAHHVLDALPTRPDPRNQLDKSRRQARRGEPPKEHPWWWD